MCARLLVERACAPATWWRNGRSFVGNIGIRFLHSVAVSILFWDQFCRSFFLVRSIRVSVGVVLIFDSSCAFSSAWMSLFSYRISMPIIGWKQNCQTIHYLVSVFQLQLNEWRWISILESEFFLCELVAFCLSNI